MSPKIEQPDRRKKEGQEGQEEQIHGASCPAIAF
jgi:hypothetical protein